MYKVVELLEMEICESNKIFYEINVLIKKTEQMTELEQLQSPLKEDVETQQHKLTKHPKEIQNFLEFLLKRTKHYDFSKLPQVEKNLIQEGLNNINLLFAHKSAVFIFDLNRDKATKSIASLIDFKRGLGHSINILTIINDPKLWMDEQAIDFWEVSMYNFYKQMMWQKIWKQGYILKQAGGRSSKNICCSSCHTPMSYSLKWFILTNQFLVYTEKPFPQNGKDIKKPVKSIMVEDQDEDYPVEDEEIEAFQFKEVLLIDNKWDYEVSKKGLHNIKLKITTNNRILSLKFRDIAYQSWRFRLDYALDHSPWSYKLERFVQDSFAPLRKKNKVRIMIDGEMYFRNVADQIQKAETEIFITDWWLCEKYYLVRPVRLDSEEDSDKYRLDKLLQKAAERGVRVNILHWRESRFAVNFNSLLTKKYLQSLHPNIKMIRHTGAGIQLWSHHAKLVIIDQQILFIGGLDICYGRWDTRNHPLYDIGNQKDELSLYPGQDFCNEGKTPLINTDDHEFNTLNREKDLRMPFHDLAVCIEGDTANDMGHHFVQFWNNAKIDKTGAKAKEFKTITTTYRRRGLFKHLMKKQEDIPVSGLGIPSFGYIGRNKLHQPAAHGQQQQSRALASTEIQTEDDNQPQMILDDVDDKNLNAMFLKNLNFAQFKKQNPQKPQSNITNRYVQKFQSMFGMKRREKQRDEFLKQQQEKKDIPKINALDINNDQVVMRAHTIDISPHDSQIKIKKHFDSKNGAILSTGVTPIKENNHIFIEDNNNLQQNIEEEEQKDILEEEEEENKSEQTLDKAQLRKLRTITGILNPYQSAEDVQIIMHSPSHILHREKMQDITLEEIEAAQKEEQQVNRRNLIQTFHAPPHYLVNDMVDANVYKNCAVQALRSASRWSLGILNVEHSIYEAYIQLIEQSQRFIYIENQFFISQGVLFEFNKRNIVKNKIALALRERILRAYRQKTEFLVMIFVPLLPAFSGDIEKNNAAVLRIQVNYQQKTMAKGKNSLIELLRYDGVDDPWRYIRFYSLRQHTMHPNTQMPMTEMIYIHSKLMIVDDTHVIIGSANINDRSMLGTRDHEVAVVISQPEPDDKLEIYIGQEKLKVSKMAHTLRTELMMEHFGLQYIQISDPIANRDLVAQTAENNSRLFYEIFKCEPDNNIDSFEKLKEVREERKRNEENQIELMAKYKALKDQIMGHAVTYPVFYLKKERLGQNFISSELVVPEVAFV